jgi:hypothetical protein
MAFEYLQRGETKPSAKEVIIKYVEESITKLEKEGFKILGKAAKGSNKAVATEIYSNSVNGNRKFILRYKNSKVYITEDDANNEIAYYYGCDDVEGVLKVLKSVLKDLKAMKQSKFYCRKRENGKRVTHIVE